MGKLMKSAPTSAVDTQYRPLDVEERALAFWEQSNVFRKLRQDRAGRPHFRFLDGPITANNPMGVHHAWGRTLNDAFIRFHAMQNESCRYQNGYDCQGLWVEVEVERTLGLRGSRTSRPSSDAGGAVIDRLRVTGRLLREEMYEHSIPVCWRCKSHVVFRLVDEWFISAEEVRQPMIEAAAKVKREPTHIAKRMETDDPDIQRAIDRFGDMIAGEVLAQDVLQDSAQESAAVKKTNVMLAGNEVTIAIRPLPHLSELGTVT